MTSLISRRALLTNFRRVSDASRAFWMDVNDEPNNGPDQVLPASSLKCWEASEAVILQTAESGPASAAPISVYTLLRRAAQQHTSQRALAVRRGEHWRFWSYDEYFHESCLAAKAFIRLGLERFHGVCIMGSNSPEWLIANFGSIFAGGMSVGVYTSNSPTACRHVAEDSQAQILVLEDQTIVDKFMTVRHHLPHVKAIIQWSGVPSEPGVLSWQELLAIGRHEKNASLEARLKLQAVNQCCTLIYTSGTTGPPKGVMCSQDNLTWCGLQTVLMFNPDLIRRTLVSYLPLSHVAALMTDCYLAVSCGSTVYFAQPDALRGSLGLTLQQVEPTSFLAVPRVWEKMHEKIVAALQSSSATTQRVTSWARAQSLGYYTALQHGRDVNLFEQLQFKLARSLVLDKVKTAVGLGLTENFVCGSAPLSNSLQRFFCSVDMPIRDAYALSETMGIGMTSTFATGGFKIGSVGKVVPLTNAKTIENPLSPSPREGEICFKGRNIFMGYLNMADCTDDTILDDGWMLSGDLGWFDSEGFLFITGRVKELVITAGGENIPPVVIEEHIKKELPILANAMLVGDKRRFVSILLTIKCAADDVTGAPLDTLEPSVVAWCKERGCPATTLTQLRREVDDNRQGEVARAVQAAIDRYNEKHAISNAQKVQRWTLLPHDFSVPTGELNNTLKLKRSVVLSMYKDIIDAMYSDDYCASAPKSKL